jgi:hypothetical protein
MCPQIGLPWIPEGVDVAPEHNKLQLPLLGADKMGNLSGQNGRDRGPLAMGSRWGLEFPVHLPQIRPNLNPVPVAGQIFPNCAAENLF